MSLTYYHPFYNYLQVELPNGEVTQLVAKDSSNQLQNFKFFAGADNLVAVLFTGSAYVVSGNSYVGRFHADESSGYTAHLTVRDVTNRSEVFYSASTVAREVVSPAWSTRSSVPTAVSGPGACIATTVTNTGDPMNPIYDFTCTLYQPNATAGTTWPSPTPISGTGTASRHIFNVRLENDAFMKFARDTMVNPENGSVSPSLTCQITAVASGGQTYRSKNFFVNCVLPVVRDPSFL